MFFQFRQKVGSFASGGSGFGKDAHGFAMVGDDHGLTGFEAVGVLAEAVLKFASRDFLHVRQIVLHFRPWSRPNATLTGPIPALLAGPIVGRAAVVNFESIAEAGAVLLQFDPSRLHRIQNDVRSFNRVHREPGYLNGDARFNCPPRTGRKQAVQYRIACLPINFKAEIFRPTRLM